MGQHKFHAHVVWDDTQWCKKAARKCGEDLAPRAESNRQTNLRKGYQHVL